jgi:hypothetical protein
MPIRAELRHLYRTREYRAVRELVRERAGDRCERCKQPNGTKFMRLDYKGETMLLPHIEGAPFGSEWRVVKVQCGAAHLNGVAGDDRPENVAWLCRGCHLHHDQPFHRETRATRKDLGRPLLGVAMNAR